jgi:cell wall-associated NlpC family hydrolase
MDDERDVIDRIAREWVGTPFADLGEVKGPNGGVDCAKFLKCVFREAGQIPPIEIGTYSPQHFLHQREERFLGWVTKFAHEVDVDRVRHGDVVLYRIGHVYSHGAIVIEPGLPHIIHAWYASRCVRRAHYLEGQLGSPKRKPRFFSRW